MFCSECAIFNREPVHSVATLMLRWGISVNNSADSHHFKSFGLRKQFLQDSHLAFIHVFSMVCFRFIVHLRKTTMARKVNGSSGHLCSGFGVLKISDENAGIRLFFLAIEVTMLPSGWVTCDLACHGSHGCTVMPEMHLMRSCFLF